MAKTLTGIVTSNKPDKTIVITVTTHRIHPIYKKGYLVTKKFMAHDEKNDANEGDKVRISETTPISTRKRFTLTKIVERAGIEHQDQTMEQVKEVMKKEKPPKTEKKAAKDAKAVSKKTDKKEEQA